MQHAFCPTCKARLEVGSFCPKDGARAVPERFGVGSQVDKYIIEARLGSGGMGEVWRGRHATVNKQVAIKILDARFINNYEMITRFRREATTVNDIRNKHLVDIFDFGELSDHRPYFVMEFLEGVSLNGYLKDGPLPFSEILHLFSQLCKGLQAAHDKGVTHRDLKPDNIFLVLEEGPLPFVKILDFGIAKLAGGDDGGTLTRTGAIFGTPHYMSPEQCEGANAVDRRSDIYSLGIILFEMICGHTPFAQGDEGAGMIISRHITMPAPAPSQHANWRRLPPEVDSFVLKVLSKDPNQRPQSASAFYAGLVEVVGDLQKEVRQDLQTTEPHSAVHSLTQAPTRAPTQDSFVRGAVTSPRVATGKPRWKMPLLWVGALSAAIVIVLVGYLLLGGVPAPQPSSKQTVISSTGSTSVPAPIKPGFLTVDASPQVECFIDGERKGVTPIIEAELTPGPHHVVLRLTNERFRIDEAYTVEIRSQEKQELNKKFEPEEAAPITKTKPSLDCPAEAILEAGKCKCPRGKKLSSDGLGCVVVKTEPPGDKPKKLLLDDDE